MQEWRDCLCDRLLERAANNPSSHWLLKGNTALEQLFAFRDPPQQPYSSFPELIQAMRKDEWGYSDFIVELLLKIQGEIFCWDSNGTVTHTT
jgi:hypothetical protein